MSNLDNTRSFEAIVTRSQHHDCQQQGRLFETACREKYDMRVFVPTFMKSIAAAGLDAEYNRYQWAGNAYILEDVSASHGIGPVRRPDGTVGEPLDGADRETCYWMGYTYRWWHYYTKQTSREIYACADYETMRRAYPGYHTLSCTMAVDKLMEAIEKPFPCGRAGRASLPECAVMVGSRVSRDRNDRGSAIASMENLSDPVSQPTWGGMKG